MFTSRHFRVFVSMILLPVALSMAVIPVLPDLAMAQSSASGSAENACMDAQMSAKANVSGGLWFLAGCGLGVIGLVLAYMVESSPPASSLMGKSPEYVALYTDCYKQEAKSTQTRMAITGCVTSTVLQVVLWVVIIAAAAASADDSYNYGSY